MICLFHFNNLLCVLPARQSSSIIIPCNIGCFKRRVKRVSSLLLKFISFHNLSTNKKINNQHENFIINKPDNHNSNNGSRYNGCIRDKLKVNKRFNQYKANAQQVNLVTIVYIFICLILVSLSEVSGTSKFNSWSQPNRYFVYNNNSSSNFNSRLSSDHSQLPTNQQQSFLTSSSTSKLKYNVPHVRPVIPSAASLNKLTQRINNTHGFNKSPIIPNHGDAIASPSRILNTGDFVVPTSLSVSASSPLPSSTSSTVHFPVDNPSDKFNDQISGQVNGFISVASSVLPETLYQKTLKRQSSSASSLNGLYTLDERNNSSNSPSSSPSLPSLSSSSSSLSSSLTSSALSYHPGTPLTFSSPSPSVLPSPSESPFLSYSSSSSPALSSPLPYLPSSSPTPSSLTGTTLGYHLTEDRYTSIDIRDLLRKELDERVIEQQKAKQQQHQQSTPLPSPSVNLFALLPPKKDDLDRLASFNNPNKNHGGSSLSSTNKINGITNGHSRNPPGVNILVFKPNAPSKGANEESSNVPKNWGETFGLPPRIPLKPSIYNEPSYKNLTRSPPSPIDSRHKTFTYHRGGNANTNSNANNHNFNNNDGFRVFSDKEGGHFGINYITRNDETSSISNRGKPSTSTTTTTTTSTTPPTTSKNNVTLLAVGGSGTVIKKVSDGIDYNDLNNNNINNNRPHGNNQDRYDYDYEGHGIDSNGTGTSLPDQNGPDEAFVNGEAYRLTTERLAYILIGSCCALSILCLIIVAFSIRCRDMCDEYKAWKKAEKLAMLNYRYQNSHARQRLRSGLPDTAITSGASRTGQGGVEANFFSHRALGEQDSNLSYPPIKASRPIFGPSCCCCPAPGSSASAWHGRGTETCPRGYFHPCPRGKLPFGAASSIQAFPRSHVPAAAVTNNFPSDEDDSLNASIIEESRVHGANGNGEIGSKGIILDSSDNHHNHHLNQCTCVEPPANGFDSEAVNNAASSSGQPSGRHHHNHHHIHHQHHNQQANSQQPGQTQPQPTPSSSHHHVHHQHLHQHAHKHKQMLNNGQTSGENDKSFNPSWLQSSIIVDELHRKHSQLVRENAKSPKTRNSDDQRYIFWSENQDRLI